jgi:hypothetical protein
VDELLLDTVGLVREILQGSVKWVDNRGAQHIMEATEDWVGGLQLRHFLYGSKGRTRVSVHLEDRISKAAIEDRVFGLAIDVGLRCKWVLTCEPAVPRKGGYGSKGSKAEGPCR